jgi:hypothetical protein
MPTETKQDDFFYNAVAFTTDYPDFSGQCAWMRGLPKIMFSPANEAQTACQVRGSGVPGDLSGNQHGII